MNIIGAKPHHHHLHHPPLPAHYWAELRWPPPQSDPIPILRDFYYAEPTLAQLAIGDLACADFDAHVRCCEVEAFCKSVFLDPSTLSPVDDAFVIFFWKMPTFGSMVVLCGVTHTELVKMNGRLDQVYWNQHHSRGFVPVITYEPPQVCVDDVRPVEIPFYWPVKMGTILEVASQMHIACDVNKSLDNKINWYFEREKEEDDDTFRGHPVAECISGVQDWATSRLCLTTIATMLEDTLLTADRWIHRLFFSWMIASEQRRMMHKLAGFDTEESLVRLFRYNHCDQILDEQIVDGTPLDQQCFLKLYPDATYMPECWLLVNVTEMPVKWAKTMPKYRNGKLHLPLYWNAVAEWLCTRLLAQAQRGELSAPKVGAGDEGEVKDQVGFIMFHMRTVNAVRFRTKEGDPVRKDGKRIKRVNGVLLDRPSSAGPVKSGTGNGSGSAAPIPANIPDIEDLVGSGSAGANVFPPCIRNLVSRRFPGQEQRIPMVAIFHHAGFSHQEMIRLFHHWNEKFPKKDKPEELDVRFQFKDYLARPVIKKIWCSYLVANAINDKGTDVQLVCPFVTAEEKASGQPPGDIALGCQQRCMPEAKYPFYGPHKYIQMKLQQQSMPVASIAAAPL